MDRRAFITASASAAFLAGCATVPRPPSMLCIRRPQLGDELISKRVAGLRPYREEGFVVRPQRFDDKLVVHNYGHGGAGITLSWGSSTLAVEQAQGMDDGPVAVLGAGVMGLTTARLLQERGRAVTIYTDQLPEQSTSWVAGGQIHPASHYERHMVSDGWMAQYRAAMAESWRRFNALDRAKYGIEWFDTYQQGRRDPPEWMMPYYPDYRRVEGADNPFPLGNVQFYRTMYVETPRYLTQMKADVLQAGGRIMVRRFETVADVASLGERVIVNCTGIGARMLFGDEGLVPMRGQLVILQPQPLIDHAYSLSPGYMFPRRDGVLLGGTFEEGQWDPTPQAADIAGILRRHRNLNAESCAT